MLNEEHWDCVTAGRSLFLSRRYLSLLKDHAPAGLRLHAALVYQEGSPVAAVAAQSLRIRGSDLAAGGEAAVRKRERAVRLLGRGYDERVLVCGNLLSWGNHGIAFADGVDPERVWPGVTEALYRMRRADRLFGETDLMLLKDLPASDAVAAAAVRPYSYRALDTEPDMVLSLDPGWTTFEDYLASLRKDYRKAIRTTHKQIDEAGLTVQRLSAEEMASAAAHVHRLYLNVQARQRFRLVTLAPTYLPALAKAFPEEFVARGVRSAEGELVGFVTTFRDVDGAVGYYIGYDRELAATGVPLYLRLLHCVVEDGIALRAPRISFGRTALEPKARLGAEPRPMRCFVKHRVEPMNLVVRGLIDMMPEPDLPPERHPFKSD
jgi:hypothetical protein